MDEHRTEGERLPITDFKAGDQVRVRDLPGTWLDAGKTATVLWVRTDASGVVLLYHVRLDGEDNFDSVFTPTNWSPRPRTRRSSASATPGRPDLSPPRIYRWGRAGALVPFPRGKRTGAGHCPHSAGPITPHTHREEDHTREPQAGNPKRVRTLSPPPTGFWRDDRQSAGGKTQELRGRGVTSFTRLESTLLSASASWRHKSAASLSDHGLSV